MASVSVLGARLKLKRVHRRCTGPLGASEGAPQRNRAQWFSAGSLSPHIIFGLTAGRELPDVLLVPYSLERFGAGTFLVA